MYKKILILIAILLASQSTIVAQQERPTLYVEDNCPFCTGVLEFIEANKLEESVQIVETNDEESKNELRALWNQYDIPPQDRAWPFLLISKSDNDLRYIDNQAQIEEYFTITYDLKEGPEQNFIQENFEILIGIAILLGLGAFTYYIWYKKPKVKLISH